MYGIRDWGLIRDPVIVLSEDCLDQRVQSESNVDADTIDAVNIQSCVLGRETRDLKVDFVLSVWGAIPISCVCKEFTKHNINLRINWQWLETLRLRVDSNHRIKPASSSTTHLSSHTPCLSTHSPWVQSMNPRTRYSPRYSHTSPMPTSPPPLARPTTSVRCHSLSFIGRPASLHFVPIHTGLHLNPFWEHCLLHR